MDLHSSFQYEERAEDRRGSVRLGRRSDKSRKRGCTGRCGMCSLDGGSHESRASLRKKALKNAGAIALDVAFSDAGTEEQLMFNNFVSWRKSVAQHGYF